MRTIDLHQHLWPERLLAALARRDAPPRLVRHGTAWTLEPAGEAPSAFSPADHDPAMLRVVGVDRLVHGSDAPVIAPAPLDALGSSVAHALADANPSRLLSLDPVPA